MTADNRTNKKQGSKKMANSGRFPSDPPTIGEGTVYLEEPGLGIVATFKAWLLYRKLRKIVGGDEELARIANNARLAMLEDDLTPQN